MSVLILFALIATLFVSTAYADKEQNVPLLSLSTLCADSASAPLTIGQIILAILAAIGIALAAIVVLAFLVVLIKAMIQAGQNLRQKDCGQSQLEDSSSDALEAKNDGTAPPRDTDNKDGN